MAAVRDSRGGFIKAEVRFDSARAAFSLRNVNDDLLRAIALQTEARAKINIQKPFEHADGEVRGQIDTAAMLNSTRAVFDNLPQGAEAAVISPQRYAPFQEAIRPFLWPAAQEAIADFNLTASKSIRRNWPT